MGAIPEDCLEKLKCSVCGYYLSCSPVYLKHNGDNLCGRCTVPHEEEHLVIRNNSYETVASVMFFPCKYKTVGCSKQLAWSQVKYHEEGCEYRPYNCPTFVCNWSGLHCNLKQHYEENHVNLLVEHPGNIKPNITKDTERHYLMPALGLLFILHLKYLVSSSKLWYCVHFLGNTQFASFFEYVLEITTGDSGNIRMKKPVQSINCNIPNKDTSIEININNMLGMGVISNFDDAVFTVSIKLNNNKCVACNNEVTSLVKLTREGCFCENCEINEEDVQNVVLSAKNQSVVPCKNANSGCSYRDISISLAKHEKWFCKLDKWTCTLCNANFLSTSLYTHTRDKHVGYVGLAVPKCSVCHCNKTYKDVSRMFKFELLSDLPKTYIKHIRCEIKVINPISNEYKSLVLKNNISSPDYDWHGHFTNDRINSLIAVSFDKPNYYGLEMHISKI